MNEWQEHKLGDLYDVSSGLSKPADQFGFGHTFISFKDVFNNYFIPEYPEGLVNSNEKDWKSCSVKKGDILITRTSETIEEVGMSSVALKDYEKSTFNGFCKRLRPKENTPIKVSPHFMGYLLRTRFFRKTVANFATMTTRASLNGESIKSIPLKIPPYEIQEEIGMTLYSLEKKISLLQEQNQTLEELAQTLFNRWFVDFEFPNENGEPYKSAGGKMIESELGEIPEGWRVGALSKLFDFLEGPGIRNWQYTESGVPFINIRLIKDNDIDVNGANFVSLEEGNGKYNHFKLKVKDMVVSTSGSLGKTAIVRESHLPLLLNTSVIRFRPIGISNYPFMYQYLKSKSFERELLTLASGSVQLNFGPTHLKQIEMIISDEDVLNAFKMSTQGIYDQIIENQEQIQSLTQLRDTLLPKLMSGELTINQEALKNV